MGLDKSKLETIFFRPPGEQTLAHAVNLSRRARFVRQADIPMGPGGFCCWCNVAPVVRPMRRYCDTVCRQSADLFTYPQSPSAKAYMFIELQDCVCHDCGEDFSYEWAAKLERLHQINADHVRDGWRKHLEPVTYHQMGYNCGDRWQVDHKIPISEGGDGVGFHNCRVICAPCHMKKSARENSFRLKRLFAGGTTGP